MRPTRVVCLDDSALQQAMAFIETAPEMNQRSYTYMDRFGTYATDSIVRFIQINYSDDLLADALVNLHKMASSSCSCLVSIVTANHSINGDKPNCERAFAHYKEAMLLPYGAAAFNQFTMLGFIPGYGTGDFLRYERLQPILHEEMARRCRLRAGIFRKGEMLI
jgi:hypothetical protein